MRPGKSAKPRCGNTARRARFIAQNRCTLLGDID
jgi:hypothetical protein